MQVTVKMFATLRQQAGWSEKTVDVPEGTTVGQLLEQLGQSQAGLDLSGRALYAAVNQEYAQVDRVLQTGDTLALFPPVSGGAAGLERMDGR
jgi:molybdopterin converting factor subunit 1